jgi:hypothetical protein
MRIAIGLTGWSLVVASMLTLGACDNTKATCEKMCSKMKECLPAQIDEAKKGLPAGAEGAMADKMLEGMKQGFEKAAEECTKSCGDADALKGKLDGAKLDKIKACLDKDCKEYGKCLAEAAK